MQPIIIECSNIDIIKHGVLSPKIDDIRNEIHNLLHNTPNVDIRESNPARFLITHYEQISEEKLNIDLPDKLDIPVEDWIYDKLVELEVESITKRLKGKSYKITQSTNSWEFLKNIVKIAEKRRCYVVKPCLCDQYTDEVYLIVTNEEGGVSKPNDYIDFLYMIYSYGLFTLNTYIATHAGEPKSAGIYAELLKQTYSYIKSVSV